MKIDGTDIVYQRLHNQRLTFSEFKKPVDVVQWHGAIQAQDFNGAKWAIAQRMSAGTEALVERAYNEGKILRTHLMRPTWHFVAPKDIRWLLRLSANRIHSGLRSSYRTFELTDDTFKQCNRTLIRALRGGKHLTRSSLKKIFNDSGIAADNSIRFGFILLHAELDGVICSGPRVGNYLTYALLDERVSEYKMPDRDEALAKLTLRYFTSHGPATFQDFMWWSGLTSSDAKNGISLVETKLTKTLCDEKIYWSSPFDAPRDRTRSAHLLPPFDEYTVAYKNRSAICDIDQTKLSTAPGGILGAVVVSNGKVVGSWKQANSAESMTIEVKPFSSLNKPELLTIAKAAERYASYRNVSSKNVLKIST